MNRPAFSFVALTNATSLPTSTVTTVAVATAANSTLATAPIVLQAIVCLTTGAGGTIAISDAAGTAASTFTITTVNPIAGTTTKFGDAGLYIGKGIQVVSGAAAGSYLFVYQLG